MESFSTVNRVSVRPAGEVKHRNYTPVSLNVHFHRHQTRIDKPFKVIVLQPHVGILGIPFCHDSVPEFSGFLHVLTMESLVEEKKTNFRTKPVLCRLPAPTLTLEELAELSETAYVVLTNDRQAPGSMKFS